MYDYHRIHAAIAAALPADLVLCIGCDDGDALDLPEAERHLVTGAREGRRRQFAAGRQAARRALAVLGAPVDALGRNADASVAWPASAVGSLSHTRGLAGALVGPRSVYCGIGVDFEIHAPFPEHARCHVLTGPERRLFSSDATRRAVFSAKEAVYKCVAPLGGGDLDFLDVAIDWNPAEPAFAVRALTARAQALPQIGHIAGIIIETASHVAAVALLRSPEV